MHIIEIFFSSGRGSFFALSAAGHARGPRVQYGASLGPGQVPWHVLFFTGLRSSTRSRPGPWKLHIFKLFVLLLLSHRPSSSQAFYFVAATVKQQSYTKFFFLVTTTDRASVHARVWAMFLVVLRNVDEDRISRPGQLLACCAGGGGRCKPTLSQNSKVTAQPRLTLSRQQRYNSSTTAPAFVGLRVRSVHQEMMKSLPHFKVQYLKQPHIVEPLSLIHI